MQISIRSINEDDNTWLENQVSESWGSRIVVSRGKPYDLLKFPGFIAEIENIPKGFLIYRSDNNNCEILAIKSITKEIGIGTRLIEEMKKIADKNECKRIWLVTTNDNIRAQDFYKKRGFSVKTIHENAIQESRKLKPQIPLIGENGIPIRDEIEMEYVFLNS